jgi:hypothetical protein
LFLNCFILPCGYSDAAQHARFNANINGNSRLRVYQGMYEFRKSGVRAEIKAEIKRAARLIRGTEQFFGAGF